MSCQVPGGGGGLYTPMVVARPWLHIVRGEDLGTTMGGPAGGHKACWVKAGVAISYRSTWSHTHLVRAWTRTRQWLT